MQVNNIQVVNNIATSKRTSSNSFRGIGTIVGNANRWAMHHLETGGFFAEFCLMDLCGLVLPRVYQGFQRNKKELGHLNYQAGLEELIREGTTGPSMFLIPISAVIMAGKLLGKATQINFNLLGKFSESFKSLGENIASSDNKTMQRAFANNLFDKLFVQNAERINHPENATVKSLESFRTEFIDKLTTGLDKTEVRKSFIERFKNFKAAKQEKSRILSNFTDLIANINAAHFKTDSSFGLSMANGNNTIKTTAEDLFLDARKYMEDVIPSAKLTFADIIAKGEQITKNSFENVIERITKVRHNGRELLCLGGTAALAAFLCIIPKLYQLSKKNPALNGLEEKKQEVSKC